MNTTILPSQLLIQDHQSLDAVFALACQNKAKATDLLQVLIQLRLHIYIEEELLFPLINRGYYKTALKFMYQEHGQMWPIIDELIHSIEPQKNYEPALCQQLFEILSQHNPKEEDAIYPPIDDFFHNDFEPVTLVDEIQQAVLPSQWQCKAIREQ